MSPSIADQLASLHPSRAPKSDDPALHSHHLLTKTNTLTDVKLTSAITSPYAPERKAKKFIIQRLLPSLTRSGATFIKEGHIQALVEDWVHDSTARGGKIEERDAHKTVAWRYGSMLLLVHSTHIKSPKRKMRNMHSSSKIISGKLLRTVDAPWGLPSSLPFVSEEEGGVPFKIVYPKMDINLRDGGGKTFQAGEPLWVLTRPGEDPDCLVPVVDFEGGRGEVYAGKLIWGVESVPWGVRVDPVWMEETIQKFDEETHEWHSAGLIQRIIQIKEDRLKVGVQESDEESTDTATDSSGDEKPISKKRSTKPLAKRDAEGNMKGDVVVAGMEYIKTEDEEESLPKRRALDALKNKLQAGHTNDCSNPPKHVKRAAKKSSTTQELECDAIDLEGNKQLEDNTRNNTEDHPEGVENSNVEVAKASENPIKLAKKRKTVVRKPSSS